MPEEILSRRRVTGDDGHILEALEIRHTETIATQRGSRRLIGARRWELASGEALDVLDARLLTVRATGEILRLDDGEIAMLYVDIDNGGETILQRKDGATRSA